MKKLLCLVLVMLILFPLFAYADEFTFSVTDVTEKNDDGTNRQEILAGLLSKYGAFNEIPVEFRIPRGSSDIYILADKEIIGMIFSKDTKAVRSCISTRNTAVVKIGFSGDLYFAFIIFHGAAQSSKDKSSSSYGMANSLKICFIIALFGGFVYSIYRFAILIPQNLRLTIQQKNQRIDYLESIEKHVRKEYTDKLIEESKRLAQHYESLYKVLKDKQEKEFSALCKRHQEDLEQLLYSNVQSAPWLAGMITDYLTYDLSQAAKKLNTSMSMRLADKSIKVNQLLHDLKEATFKFHLLKYQLNYLLTLFPSLQDYIDDEYASLPFSDKNEKSSISIQKEQSTSILNQLNENERNQLALDHYIASHKKSKWQIGRDYELYIGHFLMEHDFAVEFHGISMRLEDLGRDLIAQKNDKHYIIQCKYWSQRKQIHENHIAQLYGTTVCYALENHLPLDSVIPVFVTNSSYSDMSKRFAHQLGVHLVANKDIGDYPHIKCKINYDDYGKTYIYHLPMDQQYDSTKINLSKGDCYAYTVQEAVDKGFRRAYRWHGP